MDFFEIIKAFVLGIVEGITEWLPISSTGHMLLLDEFMTLSLSQEFKNMFFVVIQLGAIMAVVTLYFHKLNPFSPKKSAAQKKSTWTLWFKVLVACVPTVIIALPFNDFFDEHLGTPIIIASALIVYGILFIIVENMQRGKHSKSMELSDLSYKTALLIGVFQVLSVVPGTSRSGATIIGALLLGTSRFVATEFTFFLGIPTMFGASLLKIVKFGMETGFSMTGTELAVLLVGMITAYIVSVLVIRFLMNYIKKHDFKVFGYYRIILGVVVLLYFLLLAK